MEPRISLITLGVRDLPRSRSFYEALGWKASSQSCEPVCFFQLGQMVLGLYPLENLLKDEGIGQNAPQPGGISLGYNTRTRDEVEDVLDLATKAGAAILSPPTETPWGSWTSYFADPDGHPWEVSYVPQFMPAANGGLFLPD